jgi:hypothetical protein
MFNDTIMEHQDDLEGNGIENKNEQRFHTQGFTTKLGQANILNRPSMDKNDNNDTHNTRIHPFITEFQRGHASTLKNKFIMKISLKNTPTY